MFSSISGVDAAFCLRARTVWDFCSPPIGSCAALLQSRERERQRRRRRTSAPAQWQECGCPSPHDCFCSHAGADRAIASATKHSSGSAGIAATADHRLCPFPSVREPAAVGGPDFRIRHPVDLSGASGLRRFQKSKRSWGPAAATLLLHLHSGADTLRPSVAALEASAFGRKRACLGRDPRTLPGPSARRRKDGCRDRRFGGT